ncbi:MAG: hypothetical protein U0270_11070 [Labilithrix sp.]
MMETSVKRCTAVVMVAFGLGACATSPTEPPTTNTKAQVYIGDDHLAGEDGNAHPQVVRITLTNGYGVTGFTTGWLSSSNTITTAGHAIRRRGTSAFGTGYTITALAGTLAQRAALNALTGPGAPAPTLMEHPVHALLRDEDTECHGAILFARTRMAML